MHEFQNKKTDLSLSATEFARHFSTDRLKSISSQLSQNFDSLVTALAHHCQEQSAEAKKPLQEELDEKIQSLNVAESKLERLREQMKSHEMLQNELNAAEQENEEDKADLIALGIVPAVQKLYQHMPDFMHAWLPEPSVEKYQKADVIELRVENRLRRIKTLHAELGFPQLVDLELSLSEEIERKNRLQTEISDLEKKINAEVSFEQVADEKVLADFMSHVRNELIAYQQQVEETVFNSLRETVVPLLGEMSVHNQTQMIIDTLQIGAAYAAELMVTDKSNQLNVMLGARLGIHYASHMEQNLFSRLSRKSTANGSVLYDDEEGEKRSKIIGIICKSMVVSGLISSEQLAGSVSAEMESIILESRSHGAEHLDGFQARQLKLAGIFSGELDDAENELIAASLANAFNPRSFEKVSPQKLSAIWAQFDDIDSGLKEKMLEQKKVEACEALNIFSDLLRGLHIEQRSGVMIEAGNRLFNGDSKYLWLDSKKELVIGSECIAHLLSSKLITDSGFMTLFFSNGTLEVPDVITKSELDFLEEKKTGSGNHIQFSIQENVFTKFCKEVYAVQDEKQFDRSQIVRAVAEQPELMVRNDGKIKVKCQVINYISNSHSVQWLLKNDLLHTKSGDLQDVTEIDEERGLDKNDLDSLELSCFRLLSESGVYSVQAERTKIRRVLRKHLPELSLVGGDLLVTPGLIAELCSVTGTEKLAHRVYKLLYSEESKFRIQPHLLAQIRSWPENSFNEFMSYGLLQKESLANSESLVLLRSSIRSIESTQKGLKTIVDGHLLETLVADKQIGRLIIFAVDFNRLGIDIDTKIAQLLGREKTLAALENTQLVPYEQQRVASHLFLNSDWKAVEEGAALSLDKISCQQLVGLKNKLIFPTFQALEKSELLDFDTIPDSLLALRDILPEVLMDQLFGAYFKSEEAEEFEFGEFVQSLNIAEHVMSINVKKMQPDKVALIRELQPKIEALGFTVSFINHEVEDKILNEDALIQTLIVRLKEYQFFTEDVAGVTEKDVTSLLRQQVKNGLVITQIDDEIKVSGETNKYWDIFFAGQAYWSLLTEKSKWRERGIDFDLPEPELFKNADKKAEVFAAGFPNYKHGRGSRMDMHYADGAPVWRHMKYYNSATEEVVKAVEAEKELPVVKFDLAEICPFELQDGGVNRDFLKLFSSLQEIAKSNKDESAKNIYIDLLKQFSRLSEFQEHLHVVSDGGGISATIDFEVFEDLFLKTKQQDYGTVGAFLAFCIDLSRHPIAIEGFAFKVDYSKNPDAPKKLLLISELIIALSQDGKRYGSYFHDYCMQKLRTGDWQQQADELIGLFAIEENKINCSSKFYDYIIKDLQDGKASIHFVIEQFKQIERSNLFALNLKPEEADFFSFLAQLASYNADDAFSSLIHNWAPGESNPALQNYKKLLKKESFGKNSGSRWTLSSQGFIFFKDNDSARRLLIDLNTQGRLRIETQSVVMGLIGLSTEVVSSYETVALLESLSDKSQSEIVELILQQQDTLAKRSTEIIASFEKSPLFLNPERRVVFYSHLISLARQPKIDDQKIDFLLQLFENDKPLLGNQRFMKVIKQLEDVAEEPGGVERASDLVREFPQLYEGTDYNADVLQNFFGDEVLPSDQVHNPENPQDFAFAKQILHLYESETNSHAFRAMVRASLNGQIPRELVIVVAENPIFSRYHETLLKQPKLFFTSEERVRVLAGLLEKISTQKGVGATLLETVVSEKLTLTRLEQITDRLLKLPSGFIAHMLTYKNADGELEYFTNEEALRFAESLNKGSDEVTRLKIFELASARSLSREITGDYQQDLGRSRLRAQELIKKKRLHAIESEMLKYPRSFLATDKSIDIDFPLVAGSYKLNTRSEFFNPVCEAMESGFLDAQQAAELPDSLPQLMVKKRMNSFKFGLQIAKEVVHFSISNKQLDVLENVSRIAEDKNLDQSFGQAFFAGNKLEIAQKNIKLIAAMKEQLSDAAIFESPPVVITDANWSQVMMLFMMLGENSDFVAIKPEYAQIVKNLFDVKANKDFCLKKIREIWGSYLRSDKSMGIPLSLSAISGSMDEFGGPGQLKHIGALLSFQHELSKVFTLTNQKVSIAGSLESVRFSIKDDLLILEQRFDRDGWSDDDRSYFYGLSTDLIAASPTLYLEFVNGLTVQNENVSTRFTPKELKAFAKDILPLYQARIALISTTDGRNITHPLRDLSTIRRDARQFFADTNQHSGVDRATDLELHRSESLQVIKEFFAEKYGIIKLPENLNSEDVRSIQNLSKYVANISKTNESNFLVKREQILALFLALKINNLWETFRAGGKIDLQSLFTTEKAAVLQPLLDKRASLNVITSEMAQISEERLNDMQKALQSDVVNVHLSNVMTVDEKLIAVMGGLRSLMDQDAFETTEEKNFLALYQKHGSEVMTKTIGLLFGEFGGKTIEYSAEQSAAVIDLKQMVKMLEMPWSLASIKKLQDSGQHIKVVSTLVDSLEKNEVDVQLTELREVLKPNEAVVAIFTRIGEGFQPGSGAYALSQDLNELQNVVVKHREELSVEEFEILQDYLTNIRVKIEFLEKLLFDIGTKFVKLKGSDKIKKDSLLDLKIAEVSNVVDTQGLAQQVTTRMTGDINLIIENMRACLGPSRKEANNDTTLTFGDSKFFIISQGESRKGSFADQIVYLAPVKTGADNAELSFIMDGLYGTQTPEVLANHIRTVLKKMRAIKGVVEKCPISLTITANAFRSCAAGQNGEFVMNKLAEENDLAGFVVSPITDATVNIAPSALADHYVEFSDNVGRFSGETTVSGFMVHLV